MVIVVLSENFIIAENSVIPRITLKYTVKFQSATIFQIDRMKLIIEPA